ncbi:MAG: hypothetical protein AAF171_26385, partial [Cyanobacteria bacterium P01_A01_bin.116]
MPTCPRCDRAIASTALRCPHCNLALKAHGHPGIDLHRADASGPSLCATCAYDADDTCNFPKRPHAMTCTLYQDVQPALSPTQQAVYRIPIWRKNGFRLAIFILIIFSLLVISV